jgi:SAM-dependent methyltransferase
MGISRGAVRLLAMAFEGEPARGSVITFGVQSVHATIREAAQWLGKGAMHTSGDGGRRISQEELFRMLGFARVESIDFYDAEGPTYVLDLNRPVPAPLHGCFDLVYDGGTAEHCFCSAEVLCNALRLAKPGGRVIHHVPVNNWIDHGFYQFSPTLFFDFYGENGFDEMTMAFHFAGRRRESFVAYDRRDFGRLPYSFGGKTKVLCFFSARKVKSPESIVFPIQSRYRRAFGDEKDARTSAAQGWSKLRRSLAKRTFRLRSRPL